jgi:RNA polymerase sigma-70 factor (ECF subfamily)
MTPAVCEPDLRRSRPRPDFARTAGQSRSIRPLQESPMAAARRGIDGQLEQHRKELTGYCYRMLASPIDAEDAVQDTFLRAWRAFERFEGRAAFRSWLYRIATNVCLDMLNSRSRRARPMDFGPAATPDPANLNMLPEVTWIEPIPMSLISAEQDPAELVATRDTIRLAFVAALQHLPARQRAVLILCEVLRWKASEVAELLETSVASVNSALQRARATIDERQIAETDAVWPMDPQQREMLARYVDAFQSYNVDALTAVIREDASQSMPPYDMWLSGRENLLTWFHGPGIGCAGSRLIPVEMANGSVAFGQYKPSESGSGYDPWALQVLEFEDGQVVEFTFFLSTERIFPLFGLPPRLDD